MALPYEIFIGLRYLRAKRRNRTISFNTIVSIVGITLGVAALIGTVGIMTGFKEDVQAKILGTTAHILVNDRMKESMVDYEEQVKKVAGVPRCWRPRRLFSGRSCSRLHPASKASSCAESIRRVKAL